MIPKIGFNFLDFHKNDKLFHTLWNSLYKEYLAPGLHILAPGWCQPCFIYIQPIRFELGLIGPIESLWWSGIRDGRRGIRGYSEFREHSRYFWELFKSFISIPDLTTDMPAVYCVADQA